MMAKVSDCRSAGLDELGDNVRNATGCEHAASTRGGRRRRAAAVVDRVVIAVVLAVVEED